MNMDRLQETKLDSYVKETHRLKESNLKRNLLQFLEWKQYDCSYIMHAIGILKCIRWT
jgi:hypothetical protein